MTVIKDIRIYRSNIDNIDGNSLPSDFKNKELNCIIRRIVMKLRENDFTLGDFDHLYINLTTCCVENGIALAKRNKDGYHFWYKYYDVEISQDFFDMLETPQCTQLVIEIVEQVLQKYFCTQQFDKQHIHSCFSEAITQGENMLMKFKEKKSATNSAVVYLRYMDNGRYFPLLRVYDTENNLLLEKDLPETLELIAYGEIQLSMKKVTIKPRKNEFAKCLEPMTFIL